MRYQTLRFTMFYKEPNGENRQSTAATHSSLLSSGSSLRSPTSSASLLSRHSTSSDMNAQTRIDSDVKRVV